jgi:hypothetical protein
MVWVQPSRNRCSAGILTRNFASENASETQKEKKSSKTDKRKSSSRTYAMRTVEFNTEMSGEKALNCRPFSPDPSSRL